MTPQLVEQARKASGSQLARAIGPHDVMTLEYRSERLNLNTDAQGVVTRVNCG
ncbi:Peptidase inhibitor I78 family protein [compost metagenome]